MSEVLKQLKSIYPGKKLLGRPKGTSAPNPKALKSRPGKKAKTSKDAQKRIHKLRTKSKSPHKYNPKGHRTAVGPKPGSKEAKSKAKFKAKLKKVKVKKKPATKGSGRYRSASPNFSGPSARERQEIAAKKRKAAAAKKRAASKKKSKSKSKRPTKPKSAQTSFSRPKGSKVPVSKRKDAATRAAKTINARTGKPYTAAQRRAALTKQLKRKKKK